MIRLFQFPPAMGLPNASGFCLKLETWLRMSGLPYENVYTMNLGRAPKGKLPHIVDDDGSALADSGLIIEHLKRRHGVRLDDHLDRLQQAQSLMLQRTLEEHVYWCVLHFRWADDRYWPVTREAFFGSMSGTLQVVRAGSGAQGHGQAGKGSRRRAAHGGRNHRHGHA